MSLRTSGKLAVSDWTWVRADGPSPAFRLDPTATATEWIRTSCAELFANAAQGDFIDFDLLPNELKYENMRQTLEDWEALPY